MFARKLLVGLLFIAFILAGGTESQAERSWRQYEDAVIRFLYPKGYSISKGERFLRGTRDNGEEVLRITYANIERAAQGGSGARRHLTYDQLKNAWAERQLEFWETKIGGNHTIVSVYALGDGRLRFNFIVFYQDSFWALDFYEKDHKGLEYCRENSVIPKIPKKVIESVRIKVDLVGQ